MNTQKADTNNADYYKTTDYFNAKKLDRNRVKKFFEEQGYCVLSLDQVWRHVHGKLEKGGTTFFLKLSATEEIGRGTENETVWNQSVSSIVEESTHDITIPKIFETGKYENKFYYLSSFHEGNLLATKFPPNVERLEKKLNTIAMLNALLLSLKHTEYQFPKDKDLRDESELGERFIEKIEPVYEKVKGYDLEGMFEELKEIKNVFSPTVNHGDFVPWHFIKSRSKLVLIDGEHASAFLPKYYDVAYFYERLYARGESPRLAKRYLQLVQEAIPSKDQTSFIKEVRPVIAARIIIGFRDAKIDQLKDLTLYKQLRDDLTIGNLS